MMDRIITVTIIIISFHPHPPLCSMLPLHSKQVRSHWLLLPEAWAPRQAGVRSGSPRDVFVRGDRQAETSGKGSEASVPLFCLVFWTCKLTRVLAARRG